MVAVQATITGDAALAQWLAGAPAQLIEDIFATTEHNIQDVILPAVQRFTPQRTGALAGSEQASVTRSGAGASGKASSSSRYVSFVERGTARHGPARHMFQRGYEATLAPVAASYERMAVKFTETAR